MDNELYAKKGPRSIRPLVAEINSLKITNELQILGNNVESLSNCHLNWHIALNETYLGIQHFFQNLEFPKPSAHLTGARELPTEHSRVNFILGMGKWIFRIAVINVDMIIIDRSWIFQPAFVCPVGKVK